MAEEYDEEDRRIRDWETLYLYPGGRSTRDLCPAMPLLSYT